MDPGSIDPSVAGFSYLPVFQKCIFQSPCAILTNTSTKNSSPLSISGPFAETPILRNIIPSILILSSWKHFLARRTIHSQMLTGDYHRHGKCVCLVLIVYLMAIHSYQVSAQSTNVTARDPRITYVGDWVDQNGGGHKFTGSRGSSFSFTFQGLPKYTCTYMGLINDGRLQEAQSLGTRRKILMVESLACLWIQETNKS